MAGEDFIQTQPDNVAGKKVRTIKLEVVQADGTIATVEMQVVVFGDREGNPISLQPDRDLLRDLHREARLQTEILLRILGACDLSKEIEREALVAELDEDEVLDGEKQGVER